MFQNNVVVSLKANGKFLREQNKSEILLPFGTEYSIYIKNLNSVRIGVSINIDGNNVCDGNKIIVNANSTSELKGFLEGDKVKNKFKFIERTESIENHRGINIDDSLIRIEIWKELEITYNYYSDFYRYYSHPYDWYSWRWGGFYGSSSGGYITTGITTSGSCTYCATNASMQRSNNSLTSNSFNPGITVKGKEIQQIFNNVYGINFESKSDVMVLKLLGIKNGKVAQSLVYTSDKLICSSCGKKWNYGIKFCGECGTFLEQ